MFDKKRLADIAADFEKDAEKLEQEAKGWETDPESNEISRRCPEAHHRNAVNNPTYVDLSFMLRKKHAWATIQCRVEHEVDINFDKSEVA